MSKTYLALPTAMIWLLIAMQVCCASVVDTIKDSQRMSGDFDRASRTSYNGPDPGGIVGGQEVERSDASAKMAVLLLISRNGRLSTCTGAVIQKNIILTAAHCVSGVQPTDVRILFRTRVNEMPPGPEMSATRIVVHEKFSGQANSYSDLALLRLEKDAPSDYPPLGLFEKNQKITGDSVLLVGYGITDELRTDSLILRKTNKNLKGEIHLKETYLGIDQSAKNGGFCRGDSGAPILAESEGGLKILGINSFTVGLVENRQCHTASVAMLVSHFAPWIKSHAARM